ncbi:STAS domain-containing protein [Amycolatopsis umgeniensis]|uniref:Anti-anti-sigma factor n=1 Tax=Amycolatopsis umgeniensis TaxID=336628 RepID=A0A841BF57_9PSEU|nr:STAS domain-containing protein [Amycolatopsis umgeniensis]MBB5857425.1 anti-anti-sigma factor [Amycolatopsis umgeniensis]
MTSLSAPRTPCVKSARERPRGRLRLQVSRPVRETAIVEVHGDIDLGTAPRLWEMLSERLHGHGAKLIVNLSEVDFFGVTGIRVLQRAQLLADETGTALYVFPGESRCARRMLDLYDGEGLHAL